MGDGPSGSGVTIHKPAPAPQYERPVDRALRHRQERAARNAAHHARDQEFQASQAGKAMLGPPENKMDPGPPENKADSAAATNRFGSREDLAAQSVSTLRALAETHGVGVVRGDGTSGKPRKSDYVDALLA